MTFWQDPKLEPKRGYRFLMSIVGEEDDLKSFLIKSTTKPSFTVGETPHQFLNHTFYYPGKVEWQPVTVTVVDTVEPDANGTQIIMKMLEKSGYKIPSSLSDTSTISKRNSVKALGEVKIRTLDSDGEIVEEWVLNNAWIQDAKFGDLGYETEDMLNVELTFRYDNAYVNVLNGDGKLPSNATGAN
jgi:hypothetical protein